MTTSYVNVLLERKMLLPKCVNACVAEQPGFGQKSVFRRWKLRHLFIACFTALLILELPSFAVAGPPSEESTAGAAAAIHSRRQSINSIRYTVSVLVAAEAALYELSESPMPDGEAPFLSNERSEITLDLKNRRYRNEATEQVGHRDGDQARESVYLFDGSAGKWMKYQSLFRDGQGGPDLVEFDANALKSYGWPDHPIAWSCGFFHPADFTAQEKKIHGTWSQDNDGLYLRRSSGQAGVVYSFSAEEPYRLQEQAWEDETGHLSEPSCTVHEYSEEHPWLPASWTVSVPGLVSRTFTVTECEINVPVGDALFRVPGDFLQPGMIVTNRTERSRQVITESLTRAPWTPRGVPAEKSFPYSMVIGGLALSLSFGGIVVFRMIRGGVVAE